MELLKILPTKALLAREILCTKTNTGYKEKYCVRRKMLGTKKNAGLGELKKNNF